MIGKIVLVAMQVAGIIAAIDLTAKQRETLHTFLPVVCGQNGVAHKAPVVEAGILRFLDCLGELYDVDSVSKEVRRAVSGGTDGIQKVIEGYCEKTPQVRKCLLAGLESVMPCAPHFLQVSKDIQINATDSLLQGLCGDKGDRIALFFTENGKQCIVGSFDSLRACTRDFKSSMNKNLDVKTKCTSYEGMSSCVLSILFSCETQVTGIIFNSIFEHIRSMSPCKHYIKPIVQPAKTKK